MENSPVTVGVAVLSEGQVRLLLWARQFTDPSPTLYVCEQRHWKDFFESAREGLLDNRTAVLLPENLSGINLRAYGKEVERVIIPVRAGSFFSPNYGEILHGGQFAGPAILVATQSTLTVREQNSRMIPAEPAENILAPDDIPLDSVR